MDIYKYVNRTGDTIVIGAYTLTPFAGITTDSSIAILDKVDGILVDKYVNQVSTTNRVDFNSDSPVVSNSQDGGIRLDIADPTYGWHDLLSPTVIYAGASANKPSFDTFRGNIRQYSFVVNDESFHHFHLPHDYKAGSDMYIHTHWTHTASDVLSGSVTWEFEVTYSKGYARGIWPVSRTFTVTQDASTTPYTHMIAETLLSNTGGTSGRIPSEDLETDGIVEVRLKLLSNTLTNTPRIFMNFCDVHYQTTGLPTKNRNYNFWM